jgi:DNA modification methylase
LDLADEFQLSSGPAVSRPGDLWILGDHRLFCGSALEASAYDVLLEGAKAAAVFADPPYNVKIDGHVCGSGAIKHREFAMASGEMTEEEFARFLSSTLDLMGAHTDPGAVIYACMDWRQRDACRRPRRVLRSSEPLRLGQEQRRHGFALPLEA